MSLSGTVGNRPRLLPGSPALREREERLESLTALAGRLAHDFNNFLVPVLGYTALIKEDLPPESPVIPYVSAMEKSARNTENAIKDILILARAQRNLRRQETDFGQLIKKEIEHWRESLPETAKIKVKCALQPGSMQLDESQWSIALQHLFQNARFALAGGGTLAVSLTKEVLSETEAAELGLPSTETFKLVVRDDGFGMPEEILRRAFEPLFSTRLKTQALGMGLAVVHSIVRSHEGQVILESEQDIGSTVTIWLPVDDKAIESEALQPSRGQEAQLAPSGNAKILLVDDDPFTLEAARVFLQQAKIEVFLGRDGTEGLKYFKSHASELALIISDVMMPNMSGIQMAKEIRQIHPTIPMVLISGAGEEFLEEALSEIALPRPRLIKKPFRLKGLVEAAKTLLR
jgi:CheY-like chemotaxis protein/two-component sensor histidine kinase